MTQRNLIKRKEEKEGGRKKIEEGKGGNERKLDRILNVPNTRDENCVR